jgi:hypothetical protein
MATVDKNFKVKHGLIVEGTTATVNGEDIITTANTTDDIAEGSANLYFTEARAAAAVADEIDTAVTGAINALDTDAVEEGAANLYFTNQRALDATSSAYDAAGSAATAQTNAQNYADGLAVNYDAAGAASAAQTAAEGYADGVALTAENNAKAYADGLAVNYDAAGAASAAEASANAYTDASLESYTPTSGLDAAVDGYGYLKSADLSGYATESYVGTAIDNLVDGAPGLLDTLNEIAAAINDDANYATTVTTALSNKQGTLTEGANIDITNDVISVTGLASTDISDFNTAALSATASAYDAAGAAASAEQNAKDYADITFVTLTDLPGQLDDYVPTSEKGQALGVATLDASGYVPASQLNIDVSGDITTAIDALTTDDIEEGSTNLYFTDYRAIDAIEAVVPQFESVDINSLVKQVAVKTTWSPASETKTLHSFDKSLYRSAEYLVKIKSGSDTEVSKVLLTLDTSDNIAITEYGVISTDASLASITADISGSDVRLVVTGNSGTSGTMFASGTLIADTEVVVDNTPAAGGSAFIGPVTNWNFNMGNLRLEGITGTEPTELTAGGESNYNLVISGSSPLAGTYTSGWSAQIDGMTNNLKISGPMAWGSVMTQYKGSTSGQTFGYTTDSGSVSIVAK